MEAILRLQCDALLGGRIDRETATGLVTIATVTREGDSLVVRLKDDLESAGLGYLNDLRATDCNELQRRIARGDVTVTMPNV